MSPSFYALPRSPLSPRSPSRCSPGLLTPCTSEPPTSITPPPPTTTQQQQQPTPQLASTQTDSSGNKTAPAISKNQLNIRPSEQINQAYSSEPISEPVSCSPVSISRNSSDADDDVNRATNVDDEEEDFLDEPPQSANTVVRVETGFGSGTALGAKHSNDPSIRSQDTSVGLEQEKPRKPVGLDEPIIDVAVNELCARHSREELEFLVSQVSYLSVRDCNYNEQSSTLCMVIEVMNEFDH